MFSMYFESDARGLIDVWEIEKLDFKWDPDYWVKVAAQHLMYLRAHNDFCSELQTYCYFYGPNHYYLGLVAVSDNYVNVAGFVADGIELKRDSWTVEEIEKWTK